MWIRSEARRQVIDFARVAAYLISPACRGSALWTQARTLRANQADLRIAAWRQGKPHMISTRYGAGWLGGVVGI